MHIAFFDMDGTLTEARKNISDEMIAAINDLSKYCHIGIVTGSGFSYVEEQVGDLFGEDQDRLDGGSIGLYPCNGTQSWWHNGENFQLDSEASMIREIGEQNLRDLCSFLLQQQLACISDFPEMPVTGDFIVNRGSMLNYCPPGRSCSNSQRKKFTDLDAQRGIRLQVFRRLKTYLEQKGIGCVAALGGNTSIDIYPEGWDKTYVLGHYNFTKASFVGDRCFEGGNDKTIYDELNKGDNSVAYATTSPEHTIKIIREKLIPHFSYPEDQEQK
jgi:phosphomannomutase